MLPHSVLFITDKLSITHYIHYEIDDTSCGEKKGESVERMPGIASDINFITKLFALLLFLLSRPDATKPFYCLFSWGLENS